MNSETFENFFNDVSIYLNNSSEDLLAFIGDVTSEASEISEKAIFTLLKSLDDLGDIFEDNIVEDVYPSTSNDIYTTAYNTVVDLISPFVGYVCDYFWGSITSSN